MSAVAGRFVEVVKRYAKAEALRGLSLEIPAGSVVGLVGRNGAGKSTALRCLLGLSRPDGGTLEILGEDPWRMGVETKRRIGYLSEKGVPYPWATPEDLIAFCAPRYPAWDRKMEDDLLRRFRIDRRQKLKAMSMGQQRAVGLMLALCPSPEVLVLDEPAANLDAVVRRGFLEEVLSLVAKEGRTVLFSSHILSDVERVADRLAVIHEGKLLLARPLDELKERVRRVRLRFETEAPAALSIPGALRQRRSGREILATIDGEAGAAEEAARHAGAHVETQALSLEEMFLDLVGDEAGASAAEAA